MKELAVKLLKGFATSTAKGKEKGSGTLVKIILGIVVIVAFISNLALGMISSLAEGNQYINDEYNIAEEKLYKNIEEAYLEYVKEMQDKMNAREAEIIAENTTTVKDADGKDKSVCNAIVAKSITPVNYAYIFSYITHKYPVKSGGIYLFNKKEIKELFAQIAPMAEEQMGTYYNLYTKILQPEEAAALLFTEEADQKMYLVSFDLYKSLLAFANTGSPDSDTGSTGIHYTYVPEEMSANVVENCNDEIGKKVVEFAMSKLGSPYSQAQRNDGVHFDCSSLCYYAYKAAGIDISNDGASTAAAIANRCATSGQTVSYEQLQPGDLIFYCITPGNGRFMGIDHAAIYAGNGKIIDASSSKGYVVYRNIFWKERIVLCGRPR